MNTTTILIENLIQGMQTCAWMTLIALCFLDVRSLSLTIIKDYLTPISFVLFALFYWLGIIVDTMYYHVFIQRHEARWVKAQLAANGPALSAMVFRCILTNGDLAKLLLERQAHLRLLRVSLVNSALITIALVLFLQFGLLWHSPALAFCVVSCGSAVCWVIGYSWRKLYRYYVTIVQTSYRLITATEVERRVDTA